MLIEVCGTGCPKCQATKKNVEEAIKELGMKPGEDALVSEIKDIKMISARGVIITPAVIIDGVKVSEGRIPGTQEVRKWLEERRRKKVT